MPLSFQNSVCHISFKKKGVLYNRDSQNSVVDAILNSVKSVEIVHKANIAASVSVKLTPTLSDAFEIFRSGLLGTGISSSSEMPKSSSSSKTPSDATAPTSSPSSEKSIADVFASMNIALEWVGDTHNGVNARSLEYTISIHQPSFSLSNTDIEINIQGSTINATFLATEGRFVFQAGTTALQALTNVLAGSTDSSIESSLVVNYDGASDDVKAALDKAIVFRPYVGNRLEIIKQILNELNLYAVFPPNGDISSGVKTLIIKGKDSEKKKAKKRFILWRNFDKKSGIIEYPISNLSIDEGTQSLFVTGNSFGGQRVPFFSDTKETADPETFGGKTPSITSTNSGLAVSDPEDKVHGTSNFSIARNAQNNNHARQDAGIDNFKDGFLRLNVTSPGVFDLFAGETVEVVVGDNLPGISGFCFVTSVTHFWDGDWQTTFTANRTAGLGDPVNKVDTKIDASLSKGRTAISIA